MIPRTRRYPYKPYTRTAFSKPMVGGSGGVGANHGVWIAYGDEPLSCCVAGCNCKPPAA